MADTGAHRVDERGPGLDEPWDKTSAGGIADVSAPPSPAGRLRRKRPLPGGRALVGGLLVAVAALATFAVADGGDERPRTEFVIAARALQPGAVISPDDLDIVALSLEGPVAGSAFHSPEDLTSAVVVGPIGEGELLQAGSVLTPDEVGGVDASATHQMSFELDRSRALDGRLESGELVDLLATYGTGPDAYTAVVERDARVVRVDQSGSGGLDLADVVVVTLGLDSGFAVLRTTHALDAATVTLVRATTADDEAPGPDEYRGPGTERGGDA